MTDESSTVMFIHGPWLHPLSWAGWAEMFDAFGYLTMAPGWPGVPDTVDGARANPAGIADHGIEDVSMHYATIIAELPVKPILIGHSLGGMIAEKLLGENLAVAAIAIDTAQIQGALPLPLQSLWSALPVFRDPGNKHLAVSLTEEEFRDSFGSAIEPSESDALYRQWTIPAPGRPLFEIAGATFALQSPARPDTTIDNRGPLLLITGGQDRAIPAAITSATVQLYGHSHAINELFEFPHRGHSLTIDHGWPDVASACLEWLYRHGL